jgi:hypothetical protein
MATTTNNGWELPDDSDPFKDGALAMRTLGNSIDASVGTGLLGWQDFDTFTVGGTGWNFGTTQTKNGRYVQLGKIVLFDYQLTAGGTGIATGTAALTLSLPVTSNANTSEFLGNGILSDSSTSINYELSCQISASSAIIIIPNVSGSNIRLSSLLNTTIPAALATGDTIRMSGFYEAE